MTRYASVWKERGCTIMCDGWTGTTRKFMINFLVYCSEGTIFLKSVDASNNIKNAQYLFGLMDAVVEKIGEEHIVQVVTVNEASYKATGRMLLEKRSHLYWVPCATHCLDLMIEDIGRDSHVHKLIDDAQMITSFIYNYNRLLNMMRQFTDGRDLLWAGPTRFASHFISLESLSKYNHQLAQFVNSNQFLEHVQRLKPESQDVALQVQNMIGNSRFWEKVNHYLKVIELIVQVLKMVDGDDKNDMRYLHEAMDRAKERMKEKNLKTYRKWWAIIDRRWEMTLHHDFHSAGYFFNPKFQYTANVHSDDEIMNGTINVITWLARTTYEKLDAISENENRNEVEAVYPLEAEFTRPLWVFGINSYDFIEKDGKSNNIVCSYRRNGKSYLGILDSAQSSFSSLDIPLTDVYNIAYGQCCLYVEGASAVHPLSVAKIILDETCKKVATFSIIWSSSPDITRFASYFSKPEILEFPTEFSGQNAYAYFYPPSNPIYQAGPEEKPPLLLKSHGGPTGETRGILDLNVQYWTSRGWAFVDVNYGGSTGYGREFRERLLGRWGIVDVNDCCSCARFLVDSGRVDGNRLCITGRSAGGYTTLAALAFKDTFKAGASLYGVADLSLMKEETHKFESHYIDNLVGSEHAFYKRSPINFVDKFTCPVILFQGLDDKVVPPDQARKIYLALKEKGLPVALVEFEGEQHGFRKAENIKFTLEQQMVFFARLVCKLDVADEISAIKIDNFD